MNYLRRFSQPVAVLVIMGLTLACSLTGASQTSQGSQPGSLNETSIAIGVQQTSLSIQNATLVAGESE